MKPPRRTKEEQALYEQLDKNGKIKDTVQRKMAWAKKHGRKNPVGAQAITDAERAKRARIKENQQKALERQNLKEVAARKKGDGAPSVDTMRSMMSDMMIEHNINPVNELFSILTKKSGPNRLNVKDRVALLKFLTPYVTPQLRSVDVQQDLKMSVSVNIQSFKGATQEALREGVIDVNSEVYSEFTNTVEDDGLLEDVTHG